MATDKATFCAQHPDKRAGLRCNTCDSLMCLNCAMHTPTGYRCRLCVREHQNRFFKGTAADDALATIIVTGLASVATAILTALPFGIVIGILIALPIGIFIGEVGLYATHRLRTRQTGWLYIGGVVFGGLVAALVLRQFGEFNTWLIIGLMAGGAYGRCTMKS